MSYHSVINTADNRLIRAEARELVLAAAMLWGLTHDMATASKLFPDNKHRQLQFTQLVIPLDNSSIAVLLADTFKHFFRCTKTDGAVIFTDTKKLRIYRKRLEYGQAKKWLLAKNTMQYLWTRSPLAIWYDTIAKTDGELDFSDLYCIKNAESITENMLELAYYLSTYFKVTVRYKPDESPYKLFLDIEDYNKLKKLAEKARKRLQQKLEAGNYIIKQNKGDHNGKENRS